MNPRRRTFAPTLLALLSLAGLARAEDTIATCANAHRSVQVAEQAGTLREARSQALVCANAECPRLIRSDCTRWAEDLDARIPTIVLEARTADGHEVSDVRVLIDGERLPSASSGAPIPVDPGDHVFRFEASGSPPVEQRVTVPKGARAQRVRATLLTPSTVARPQATAPTSEPPQQVGPRPSPARATETPSRTLTPLTLGLGALGVVATGVFAGFGVAGVNGKSRLDEEGCRPRCDPSEVDAVQRQLLVADVGLVVAVVALGAAALTFAFGQSPRSP
jgi:hypothetical protein